VREVAAVVVVVVDVVVEVVVVELGQIPEAMLLKVVFMSS
jgi:hypothetical protein